MHDSVYNFVAKNTKDLRSRDVLEVGSYNVNGSVRELFDGRYVGTDIQDGPGVDLVVNAHELSKTFEAESFDVVLCLEMLEHDSAPWVTCIQLGRIVKPGGTLIITTRGNGFPEHNNPDRWRFMKDGMRTLLKATGCKLKILTNDPEVSGWLAVCVKE